MDAMLSLALSSTLIVGVVFLLDEVVSGGRLRIFIGAWGYAFLKIKGVQWYNSLVETNYTVLKNGLIYALTIFGIGLFTVLFVGLIVITSILLGVDFGQLFSYIKSV